MAAVQRRRNQRQYSYIHGEQHHDDLYLLERRRRPAPSTKTARTQAAGQLTACLKALSFEITTGFISLLELYRTFNRPAQLPVRGNDRVVRNSRPRSTKQAPSSSSPATRREESGGRLNCWNDRTLEPRPERVLFTVTNSIPCRSHPAPAIPSVRGSRRRWDGARQRSRYRHPHHDSRECRQ